MAQTRYTITHKLADGGMAEVYLGTQHGAAGFERPIVIKRIRQEFSADATFRTMLLDEAHISMRLQHGNIVAVLDLGTMDGQFFQVLELVDGWDVETLIRRGRAAGIPLPPAVAFHVAAQVCRALLYVHSRSRDGENLRIVHRDVSPENILASVHGEVKLGDFGIATALNKKDRTSAGVVKGKLGFMSPEQASGLKLDGRSDLYSVGCALYVMLSGVRPFQGKTDLEVLIRQQQGSFVPLREVAPGLPADVVALVERALQQFPEKRFANAEQMLRELERVQREQLGAAGQTELKDWLDGLAQKDGALPTSRRPPAMPGDAQGLGTELLSGTALILDEPDAPKAVPGRRRALGVLGGGAAVLLAGGAGAVLSDVLAEEGGPEVELDESGAPLERTGESPEESNRPLAPGTVSVKFRSDPAGATVVVNGKAFGATPMGIRFRTGLTHEVYFRKEGYAEQFRRVYVSAAKGQSVEVTLSPLPGTRRRKWWRVGKAE